MENLPNDVRRAYQNLAEVPKYQHFIRIPDRIVQCIDHFGIGCEQTSVRLRLHTYYLFIGVVDDAIDSGRIDTGSLILEYLSTPAPVFDERARRSSVKLMTEVLKTHISDETYPFMITKLRELYGEVVSERGATSIDSYIGHRKSVGALTAELSYLLIRPSLAVDNECLCRFMKQVGEVGCLVDSLIDLNVDRRLGLLMFKPTIMDRVKLVVATLQNGLRVVLRHPGLSHLFLQAVCDNIRDRFTRSQRPDGHYNAADRKGTAPSVA